MKIERNDDVGVVYPARVDPVNRASRDRPQAAAHTAQFYPQSVVKGRRALDWQFGGPASRAVLADILRSNGKIC